MVKEENNSQNTNKWFEIKEKSAGEKRLELCWFLYKHFGKKIVYIIAFFVSFFTFLLNKDLRNYSKQYFLTLYEFTKEKRYKPNLLNCLNHVLSYGYSLVDKMLVFGGEFDIDNVKFDNTADENELNKDIEKGVFFICNHIGNIDIMRVFTGRSDKTVSVFLQKNQCEIFNNFINNLLKPLTNLKTYPVEEIDIATAIELEEDIKSGGVVFMAGDRISATESKTASGLLLNKRVELPQGVFKLAKLMPSKIYFVSCLKDKKSYKIYLKKSDIKNSEKELIDEFLRFTEEMIIKSPYQFYHFYNYFR